MSRHQKKDNSEREARWNNSPTNSYISTSDVNWSQRYLHFTNEVDEQVSYLESSMFLDSINDENNAEETPTPLAPLSHDTDNDEEASYRRRSSSHQYLRKSKQDGDRVVVLPPLDEIKKEEKRVESRLGSSREEKRRERQNNRSGIPSVISLSQPLLPASTTTTTTVYLGKVTWI